jgi:hypothetical protein
VAMKLPLPPSSLSNNWHHILGHRPLEISLVGRLGAGSSVSYVMPSGVLATGLSGDLILQEFCERDEASHAVVGDTMSRGITMNWIV